MTTIFHRSPAIVQRDNPYVRVLADAIVAACSTAERISVGRDGASDIDLASSRPACPAVEFGPAGGGHHGPEEWVSVGSLGQLPPGAGRVRRSCSRPAGAGDDEPHLRIA